MRFLADLGQRLRDHPAVSLGSAIAAIAGVVGVAVPTDGFWPKAAVVLLVVLVLAILAAYSFWQEVNHAELLNLSVEIGRLKLLEPTDPKTEQMLVVVSSVRITNRSSGDHVSLGVRFIADRYLGELRLSTATRNMPPSVLRTPLRISSQESEAGMLAFTLPQVFADMFGANLERALEQRGKDGPNARLEIEDFVSGRSIVVPVPGSHS